MKDLNSVVEDLFYSLSDGIHYDAEYKKKQADLDKRLGKLLKRKGIVSPFESFLKDILENIEDIEDSFMTRDVKQEEILNEIENAIDEREMQAIKIACRSGILCGISLCKNRGNNYAWEEEKNNA